jgi:acyl-CoA reductase-like NAD-dependent aldehyde dehydrogenase
MAICAAFAEHMVAAKDRLGRDLTRQMGRPIRYTPGEIAGGLAERTRRMVELAPAALADVAASDKPGFTRFVRKEPLGVVFVVAPWNYPYLTAVNAIVPALVAGNAVILKHSHQTPLVAEAFRDGLARAGLPDGVFQVLHLGHADTEALIGHPGVDFVAFTGSVQGGHAVTRAAKDRFIGLGLELGGKDPAYVRADCDLDHAVENLVDGAFFNSGQSCCGIERIYVHADVHDRFVDGFVALTNAYVLGDPLDPATTLGPMVRASAADFVRGQVADAVAAGARSLVDPRHFPADAPGTPYLAPHVLVGVDHSMRVMTEESFGPVIGIMKVSSDEEAIRLMNDSAYGLTAAIWTSDEEAALSIGARVETGTWFMNRCDYLDPELAWTGVKDSGRGCTLSRLGYDYLTRPKSFHLRTTTK